MTSVITDFYLNKWRHDQGGTSILLAYRSLTDSIHLLMDIQLTNDTLAGLEQEDQV